MSFFGNSNQWGGLLKQAMSNVENTFDTLLEQADAATRVEPSPDDQDTETFMDPISGMVTTVPKKKPSTTTQPPANQEPSEPPAATSATTSPRRPHIDLSARLAAAMSDKKARSSRPSSLHSANSTDIDPLSPTADRPKTDPPPSTHDALGLDLTDTADGIDDNTPCTDPTRDATSCDLGDLSLSLPLVDPTTQKSENATDQELPDSHPLPAACGLVDVSTPPAAPAEEAILQETLDAPAQQQEADHTFTGDLDQSAFSEPATDRIEEGTNASTDALLASDEVDDQQPSIPVMDQVVVEETALEKEPASPAGAIDSLPQNLPHKDDEEAKEADGGDVQALAVDTDAALNKAPEDHSVVLPSPQSDPERILAQRERQLLQAMETIAKLHDQIHILQQQEDTYIDEINTLRTSLEDQQANQVSSRQVKKYEQSIQDLNRQLSAKEEQVQGLMLEGEKLSKNELKQTTTIKRLRAEKQDVDKSLVDVQSRLDKATADLTDANAKVKSLTDSERRAQ
ncbi:hypothetical protein DM01DRAFT_330843, partial [Hesseltinella vesiculosa]